MATYVPNASDATQPTGDKFVGSADEEFRALKARVNAIAGGGGGGGGGAVVLGGLTLPNFGMDAATPSGRIVYEDTNPMGWNVTAGRMTVQFDMLSNGYFAANPNGHLAIVLRCETGVIASAVRGQGVAIGNATGFTPASDLNPTPVIETWHNSTAATYGNTLYPNTDGARSKGGMSDGVLYRFMIDAVCTQSGQRFVRYRMWARDAANQKWVHYVDSGDIHDANIWADLTQYGLAFGHVFPDNLSAWDIQFQDIKVTWGPAESDVPDQSSKLSRFGAELEGNLRFIGNGRRVLIGTETGDLANWTAFQNRNSAADTRVLAIPGASATTAEFIALNNAGANAQGVGVGIEAGRAVLRGYQFGSAAAVPFDVWVGGAVRFTTTSTETSFMQNLKLSGASRKLQATHEFVVETAANTNMTFRTNGLTALRSSSADLGAALGSLQGVYNWDNTPAKAFATAPFSFDMEVLCTTGNITAALGGTYSAGNIENVLRPLYSIVSNIVDALYKRRIFTY